MAQPIPQGYFAHNTEVLGYHDLNGKPAFKLAMQEMNDRWYLYLAHLWHQGWSILDVTDPTAPQFVAFLPGPENTWTIQIQVADGKMITALGAHRTRLGRCRRKRARRRGFDLGCKRPDQTQTTRPLSDRQHGDTSKFL